MRRTSALFAEPSYFSSKEKLLFEVMHRANEVELGAIRVTN